MSTQLKWKLRCSIAYPLMQVGVVFLSWQCQWNVYIVHARIGCNKESNL